MSNLTKLLHKVFDGWPTVHNAKSGRRNAVLPLTDFHPANHGADLALLASGLAALVPNWDDVSAIVGVADRNAGTLVHQVSVETRVPYTLAIWYPAGSKGDIVVEKSGGFTGGDGVVLLNGLHAGDKVIYIDDMIRSGDNAYAVIESMKKARVQVLHALRRGRCGPHRHEAHREEAWGEVLQPSDGRCDKRQVKGHHHSEAGQTHREAAARSGRCSDQVPSSRNDPEKV